MRSCFKRLGESVFSPTTLTIGPWNAKLAHGGPPSALSAQVLFEAASRHYGNDAHFSRLTVSLLRPVVLDSVLRFEVEEVNVGKNAAHLACTVFNEDDKKVLSCSALVVKSVPVDLPFSLVETKAPKSVADSTPCKFPRKFAPVAYDDVVEMRLAEGVLGNTRAGPSAVWMRSVEPLIEGDATGMCGMARVAMIADSANGVGAVLNFQEYAYANADLSISLFKSPRTEWTCLRSQTLVTKDGVGMVDFQLFDEDGLIGRGTLNQIVSKKPKL